MLQHLTFINLNVLYLCLVTLHSCKDKLELSKLIRSFKDADIETPLWAFFLYGVWIYFISPSSASLPSTLCNAVCDCVCVFTLFSVKVQVKPQVALRGYFFKSLVLSLPWAVGTTPLTEMCAFRPYRKSFQSLYLTRLLWTASAQLSPPARASPPSTFTILPCSISSAVIQSSLKNLGPLSWNCG